MDTEIDWQRELDSSFGSRPDVPAGHYVAAGHRAVRRRRRVGVVAGLAAAAVVAGMAWGVAPDRGPSGGGAPIATDPDGTTAVSDAGEKWGASDPPARFDGTGVEIREGAVVHERRDDLYPDKPTESAALDVSYGGERWWVAIEWGGTMEAVSTIAGPEDGRFESFEAFVREQVRGGGMISRPPRADDRYPWGGLVDWDGGEVIARRGVEVEATVEDPVPSSADSLGLELREGGETTWMVITRDGTGGAGATWSKETDTGWATFEEWLAEQVALLEGTDVPTPVRLEGTEVVAAAPGVDVLEQQADPNLRAYGTDAAGTTSAVALLEWKDQRWFVLVLDDSVSTVAVDKAGGATTLDEFVAFMADKADEGGMR